MSAILDQLKELERQREKIIGKAKQEALDVAEAGVATLNELGFNYHLVEKGSKGKKGTRSVSADKPCGYCNFKTNPPHDKRAHRNQADKKPFTGEELRELGMTRS